MLGWSKEYSKFKLTGFCPSCGKMSWRMPIFEADGKERHLIPPWKIDESMYAQCFKCNARFPVLAKSVEPQDSTEFQLINFSETSRTEEPIGEDKRLIDNSASSIRVTRRFLISKEWSRLYTIDYEKSKATSQGISVDFLSLGNITSSIENSLKVQYAVNKGEKLTYSEEVIVEIPANTRVSISFQWKRLWQKGNVLISYSGKTFSIPFCIVVGLTFDQSQKDEKN